MAEATLIVRTDKSGAETIDRIIQDNGGSAGIVTEPKHLGGDVATWVVAVTASTQALPPLLAAIKNLVTHDRGHGDRYYRSSLLWCSGWLQAPLKPWRAPWGAADVREKGNYE
jgi:hypothetical protein